MQPFIFEKTKALVLGKTLQSLNIASRATRGVWLRKYHFNPSFFGRTNEMRIIKITKDLNFSPSVSEQSK